jgi:phenylalanyl-tRNA synthetase beta chain
MAVALLREVSPGIRLVGGVADVLRPLTTPTPIELPLDWLTTKLGRSVEQAEVESILTSLGFGVAPSSPASLSVTVPSWRATKDVTVRDDLVEEVGRMLGYDSVTPRPPRVCSTAREPGPRLRTQRPADPHRRRFHRSL